MLIASCTAAYPGPTLHENGEIMPIDGQKQKQTWTSF